MALDHAVWKKRFISVAPTQALIWHLLCMVLLWVNHSVLLHVWGVLRTSDLWIEKKVFTLIASYFRSFQLLLISSRRPKMSRSSSTTRWRGSAKPPGSPSLHTGGWRTGKTWSLPRWELPGTRVFLELKKRARPSSAASWQMFLTHSVLPNEGLEQPCTVLSELYCAACSSFAD